jgi:uncharacterized protein (TIGR00369 family)
MYPLKPPSAHALSTEHYGSFIGLESPKFEGDYTIIDLDTQKHHLNQLGVVHGGVMTSMLDTAMGNSCFFLVKKPLVTVELKVSFMRPVFGGKITARARVLKKGEHLIFASASVFDFEGLEVAAALGTYMMVDTLKR